MLEYYLHVPTIGMACMAPWIGPILAVGLLPYTSICLMAWPNRTVSLTRTYWPMNAMFPKTGRPPSAALDSHLPHPVESESCAGTWGALLRNVVTSLR